MTDLASLGLRVESQEVDTAERRLDSLTASAGRVETATQAMSRTTQQAMGGVSSATGRASSAAQEMANAIRAEEAAMLSAARASGTFAASTAQAEAALGSASAAAKRTTMSFADLYDVSQRDFAAQYVKQADNVVRSHGRVSKAAGLTASETLNLSRQFADLGVTAAMGMNPLMILIQQGPQIADIFQTASHRGVGFKAALSGIASMVGPVLAVAGPLLAIVGVLGLLAASAWQAEKAVESASMAILGQGRAAGLTASEVVALADANAKAAELTVSGSRAAANGLLQMGVVNQDVMTRAIAIQRDFALVTGQDSAKAAEDLAKALADPAKGIEDLDKRLNLFDDTTKQYLLTLARQNDQTAAQKGLLAALEAQIGSASNEVNGLAAAWHNVWTWASNAFAAMGAPFSRGTDEKIANAEAQLATARKYRGGSAQIEQMEERLAALKVVQAQERAVAQAAKAQADHNRETKFYGDLVRGLTPLDQKRADVRSKLATLESEDAKRYLTEADRLKGIAAAKKELAAIDKREAGSQRKDPAIARAENLAREAKAMESTIAGNLALAAAYGESEAAAMKQIAVTKATSQAIQKQGDIDAFVARQIALNVSEQAVAGAKRLADLKAENAARAAMNDRLAAGEVGAAEANRLLKDEATLRPLIAAEALAEGEAKTALAKIIADLRGEQRAANDEDERARKLERERQTGDTLATLALERDLIGAGNAERAIRLAQLREEQAIRQEKGASHVFTPEDQARIGGATDIARQQAANAIAQDLYNKALDRTLDRLTEIDDLVQSSAGGLADAFDGMSDGAAGFTRALGGVLSAMNRLAATEEKVRRTREASWKVVEDAAASGDIGNLAKAATDYNRMMVESSQEMAAAQMNAYGNMASAAKGFFEEGSAGYKALQAAEIAFRAIEFAMSVRAMFQNATETAASVANSGTKATASVTAGAAKMFEEGGWFGFIGVAAMLAVMAGLGFSGGGGVSSGGYDLEKVQANQGTGSVLGDASAKSESISRSLDLVAEHTNDQLEYSNAMLRALRGIESQMESVAAAIARQLGIGGALDPEGVKGLGTVTADRFMEPSVWKQIFAPGGLDPLNLFDSTTTKKLVDAGLQFTTQSLADILSGGISAAFFQTVETRKKTKAFGMTVSESVKNKTITTAIDEDLSRQLGLIVSGLRDGVLAAASVLGVEGAGAVLDAFKLNIGNISFKGMKADEISATLEAVFSKLGDDMAGAVLPGLTEFQKAGEGLFETLMRVARQYQVIDVTLASIGMTFDTVGVSSLAARERLVDLFGSLDEFVEQTAFYAENFLTEAERLAPIQSAVTTELNRLGLANVRTRDQFKAVVQGLDVSTAAGAELYAALMALAPAFAAITEETEAIRAARDDLSSAYDRESSALADTIDRFTDLASSLGKYRTSLFSGPAAALSPEEQYRAARAEFDRINALAATGDQQALGDLQSVSEAYLEASRAYYASSQGYFADLARVRDAVTAAELSALDQVDVAEAQLDELKALVAGFLDINESVLSVRDAVDNLAALLAPTLPQQPLTWPAETAKTNDPANDNAAVIEAIAALQEQMAEVGRQLAAANDQRAGVHAETIKVLEAQQAALERQLREMQAA